jgi:hypothetical protein
MPRFDGTGPDGMGPIAGRRMWGRGCCRRCPFYGESSVDGVTGYNELLAQIERLQKELELLKVKKSD